MEAVSYTHLYYFICGNYAKISKEKYNCNRWKEEVIDELVYRALIMQLKTVCELKTQLKRFNGEYFETFQKYLNREQSKMCIRDRYRTVHPRL